MYSVHSKLLNFSVCLDQRLKFTWMAEEGGDGWVVDLGKEGGL